MKAKVGVSLLSACWGPCSAEGVAYTPGTQDSNGSTTETAEILAFSVSLTELVV